MTIDELNALTTLTATDEVPVWDSEESGEPTKKITASNLAASVKSLASLPNTTEMNNAIAQSTASVLSKFAVITGTTPSTVNTQGDYNLPSGFASDNSVIVGYTVQFSNNTWYSNAPEMTTGMGGATLRVTVSIAGYTSKPFKVLIAKL